MTKLLYFTDLHYTRSAPRARKDDYAGALRIKMDEIATIAKKFEPTAILFGGDLFHKKQNVTHTEVREVIEMFREFEAPVYGVLGNHDIAAYQASTVGSRPAGVVQAAGVIKWLDVCATARFGSINGVTIHARSYCAGYETPHSYGVGAFDSLEPEERPTDKIVWLSHGLLVEEGKSLPYEHTFAEDIADTAADVVLNGHYHTKTWEKKTDRGNLIINAGSIGRVDIGDKHRPSVVLLVFDDKKNEIRHKIVKLTSAQPHGDVLERVEESSKSSDEDIHAFVKALEEETGDLRTEDLRAAVDVACKGKGKKVKAAVSERLGV